MSNFKPDFKPDFMPDFKPYFKPDFMPDFSQTLCHTFREEGTGEAYFFYFSGNFLFYSNIYKYVQ